MDLFSHRHSLISLVIFQNTVEKELIRSLHVYGFEDGKEREVEREFLFRKNGSYVEMEANPLLRLEVSMVSELSQGTLIGLWLCIFMFDSRCHPPSFQFTSLLSISRNPKLKAIPSLANDLQMIFKIISRPEYEELEICSGDKDSHAEARRKLPVFDQDLNCIPDSVATSEQSESYHCKQQVSDITAKKKKRAPSDHVARLALEDLAKYFGLPIVEASRNLKVGLTVLKKKCREFGIPRWPHRKIKSLDSLIRDLQEEAERQREKNKAAAMAVGKRQKMLEREKENIERKPFMEIESETKRFRQDIFKRRHRARALKTEALFTSTG